MSSSSRRPWRRRPILLGGVLLAVVLLAGVIGAIVLESEPGDVSNSDVGFERGDDPSTVPQPAEPQRGEHPMDDGFSWPNYHLSRSRTGYLPLRRELRPPFVEQWSVTGRILLEFPPVSCRRSLYLLKNNGALYKISRLSGRVAWKRKLGYLAASSPSCGGGSVYAALLEGRKGGPGRILAVNAKTGRTRWSKALPSRAESSPLLASGRVYFGTEDGAVYATRASDGAVRWKAHASGAVKGGLALSRGRLIFGDYAGKVHAVSRRDGHELWESSSAGTKLGLSAGSFYGTPAVAYGRVYIGSLDGFVYSFGAADGRLAWRHKTGGYVYSSPAVATVPGAGPTVYVGSFDGRLYAFDARSGSVRWRHDAGGRISGGPVVFGDLVFFSNLARKSTTALGAATGKRVWATRRGAFNPAISDGRRIYLNGYSSLFMLSSRRQARIDERARRRLGRAAAAPRRQAERRAAARERSRRRSVDRRVAARRAAVHRAIRLRRAGREVCFTRSGHKVCRVPRRVICFKRGEGGQRRTVCRSRRP